MEAPNMHCALHTLNLVLPKRPHFSLQMNSTGNQRVFRWPCGCIATGPDDAGLDVVCCNTHVDLLAPSPRGVRD
jgi:hypothetical protein